MNCAGCLHRDRDQLDAQLVQGVPYRTIAQTFDLSLGAISRHKRHVKEMIHARTPTEMSEHGSTLLDRVLRLADEAEKILASAKERNDFRGANGALGAAAKLLDLCGRLSGELQGANAGGIHLTMNRVTNNTVINYDDDVDFARMIGEATKGFSLSEFQRLQRLAVEELDSHKSAIAITQSIDAT